MAKDKKKVETEHEEPATPTKSPYDFGPPDFSKALEGLEPDGSTANNEKPNDDDAPKIDEELADHARGLGLDPEDFPTEKALKRAVTALDRRMSSFDERINAMTRPAPVAEKEEDDDPDPDFSIFDDFDDQLDEKVAKALKLLRDETKKTREKRKGMEKKIKADADAARQQRQAETIRKFDDNVSALAKEDPVFAELFGKIRPRTKDSETYKNRRTLYVKAMKYAQTLEPDEDMDDDEILKAVARAHFYDRLEEINKKSARDEVTETIRERSDQVIHRPRSRERSDLTADELAVRDVERIRRQQRNGNGQTAAF